MTQPDRDLDILVIGEINPDIIVTDPDPAPRFGEIERVVESVVMTVGSSSAIFACGAAKLGLRVAFCGVVGDDPLGRYMLEALAGRGIDVSACTTEPSAPTGATVILSSGRDRAMLTAMGTIGALDVDAVPVAMLRRARHLHLGSYFAQSASRDRLPRFYATARDLGLTTSFDTNWDPADRWDGGIRDMLAVTDLFFPNAMEARRITGVDDVEDAARMLASVGSPGRTDGGPLVVVKLGAEGALACGRDGHVVRVASLAIEPVDTTGAGDTFDAGFVRAWLDGATIRDSLEIGVACGALSTRAAGGVDAQPTLAEARLALAERVVG